MITFPSIIANNLFLEIDHICIYLPDGARGTSVLEEVGIHSPARAIKRAEQGTVSRLIVFENAYLELIWIEDENAAKQHAAQTGIDMLARSCWRQTRASPFGISLRRSGTAKPMSDSRQDWDEGMRPEIFINFATDNLACLVEPMCFLIPDSLALTSWLDCKAHVHQQLLSHPLGTRHLTSVKIAIDSYQELSDAVSLISRQGEIAIERGSPSLLELTFDSGVKGKVLDLRPALPIILNC
jgi:hypothetical protein